MRFLKKSKSRVQGPFQWTLVIHGLVYLVYGFILPSFAKYENATEITNYVFIGLYALHVASVILKNTKNLPNQEEIGIRSTILSYISGLFWATLFGVWFISYLQLTIDHWIFDALKRIGPLTIVISFVGELAQFILSVRVIISQLRRDINV